MSAVHPCGMAQDYARLHDYYMPLHELQPPSQYNHYDMTLTSASTAPGFELTAAVGAGCNAGASHTAHAPHHQSMQQNSNHHHDPRKRKNSHYSVESYDVSSCEASLSGSQPLHQDSVASSRKRKPSSYGTASTFDDDGLDDSRSSRTAPDKKQNHSEIEKRRRDKMNTYITELSAMIPMCGAMARKLDKLTVLRMAVQHLRSVRGALTACPLTSRPRPALVSERELNALILHAARDCFLLVVGCDRGRLLYVSRSVTNMLHYEQSELLGQSLFDILHPKDVAKVKEQLSSSDLSPRERLIDAKTMLPVKADVVAGASRLCPGARRSFFCRIKCKLSSAVLTSSGPIKEEAEPAAKVHKKQNEKKYCVVQCTGYLKSWAPVELSEGVGSAEATEDGEGSNVSCLVAVGRALPDLGPSPYACTNSPTRLLQYVSRHAPDGKFLFVDQRVTLALGFLPQELLGTSLYEYVSGPELGAVASTHKSALLQRESLHTPPYLFRRKDGNYSRIQTHFKPFKNPWTKDVECLVANNSIVTESHEQAQSDTSQSSYDTYKQTQLIEETTPHCGVASSQCKLNPCLGVGLSEGDAEMQRLIESQVESHKIGSAIAEEVLRRSSTDFSPDMTSDLLQDAVFEQWPLKANVLYDQASLVDNILGVEVGYNEVRNNVPLSAAGAESSPPPATDANTVPCGTPPPASPPLPPLGIDGNGEAAMAVIMSLLEADAGLGGPVNFSGLPWPLP